MRPSVSGRPGFSPEPISGWTAGSWAGPGAAHAVPWSGSSQGSWSCKCRIYVEGCVAAHPSDSCVSAWQPWSGFLCRHACPLQRDWCASLLLLLVPHRELTIKASTLGKPTFAGIVCCRPDGLAYYQPANAEATVIFPCFHYYGIIAIYYPDMLLGGTLLDDAEMWSSLDSILTFIISGRTSALRHQ